MLKCTITLLLSISCFLANAQNIIVPANIYFADQHLVVSESGRREIQRQVDALLKYPTYFQAKVDRTDTYFPIIERIFRAEGLPDDFKYLTLQESGLTSDAVSTSNAVGFWQFKKEAAADQGMRINQDVDERKHIIESTRSAARYLVKHNNIYYKNWHNTLLSYLLGLNGAKSYAKPEHVNKKEMEVTDRTHPYILTFLAHKVAFSSFVGRNPAPKVMLQEMTATGGKSIHDIALETQTDAGELQKYNKWLSSSTIPYDKTYTVLVPVTNPDQVMVLASNRATEPTEAQNGPRRQTGKREFRELNNLRVIIARPGDTKNKLAAEAKISPRRFLVYNDMYGFDPIVPGEPYYLEAKHSKADVDFHVVKAGEQIHQISQQYGVKMRNLVSFNRMRPNENLKEGRLLYMQRKRPANVPIEYQKQYPINEPVTTPAQPEVLARNKSTNPRSQTTATATESRNPEKREPENTSMAATLENKLNKWLGVKPKPEKVQEVEVEEESNPEYTASSESTIAVTPPGARTAPVMEDSPVDVAIAQTNEEEEGTEDTLSENIDKQVEIENKTPVLYRRTKTAEPVASAPVKKETPAPTEAVTATAKPLPAPKEAAPVAAKTPVAKPVYTAETKTEEVKPAEFPRRNPTVHVVAKGETLYGISRMYQVALDDLKNWNNLGEIPLAIGQSLILTAPAGSAVAPAANNVNANRTTPAAAPAVASTHASGSLSHTVSAGESMYQISRKYGVTIKEIMDWNNKADFNVKPGEKLVIKAAANSRN